MAKTKKKTTTTKKRSTTRKKTATRKSRKRAITPEDIKRLNYIADPQVAPDGSCIVFQKKHVGNKNEYVANLWMVETSGEGSPRQFTSGERDGHPRWSPCGTRVAFIAARDKHCPQIFTIDAAGGEAVKLTDFAEGSIGGFKWSPDGRMLALTYREQHSQKTQKAAKEREEKGLTDPPKVIEDWWYRLDGDGYFLEQRYALYLVDTATGKHRKVYSQDIMGDIGYDFSPDSRFLVISTNRDKRAMVRPWKSELLRLNIANGKLMSIPKLPPGPKTAPKWSPDGKWIAYAGRLGEDDTYSTENLELFVCDAVKGGARSLTKKEDYCLMAATLSDTAEAAFDPRIQWSPDSRRLLMQLGWHGEVHVASVPRRGGAIEFLTSGSVVHGMGNVSADGSVIALTVDSATRPPEVAAGDVDRDGIGVTKLTNMNGPLLRELQLSKPQSHWVKTPDGTKVQVWTMLPPGFGPRKKYPAVLEVHGGPHAQYGVGFFHEFQVLVGSGYVVFYSNPRGSKGYGRDHCAAIRGSWGGADWVDVKAATRFMKEQTFVDPKRMGIMGGSYGGYMTCWAIGHTNVFAGAISDRCVSNLVSMFGNSDFCDEPDRYWEGNAWDRPEARWNSSPVKCFNKLRTPTLLIHSEGDLRCNVEQSEQVFTALRLKNVSARFVRYPTATSHGMSRNGPPDMRLHRLHEILNWWSKYLAKKTPRRRR